MGCNVYKIRESDHCDSKRRRRTIVIERAEDYHMERPDETDFNGFEGETIYIFSQTGEAPVQVNKEFPCP